MKGGRMLENSDFVRMLDLYPECREAFILQQDWDNEGAFQKLICIRDSIPKELYGSCLHYIYIEDIDGVKVDTIKKAFQGVDKQDIMLREDLKMFEALPSILTIYRGSQDFNETKPRISWSLSLEVAKAFGSAHLFKSVINKDDVVAYISKNTGEEEIVAFVNDNYEVLY